MKCFKRITVFTVFLLFVFTFSGCTKEEQRLLSSLEKLSNANAYDMASHVTFELDFSGGNEGFQDSMQKAKYIIDSLEINMLENYEGNLSENQVKAFLDTEVASEHFKVGVDLWLDADLNRENPKYQVIVKIPALAKSFLPSEYAKDYLNIDYFGYLNLVMEEAGISDLDFVKNLFTAMDMQKQTFRLYDILMQMQDLDSSLVKSSTTDGGAAQLTLSMTDAQLKQLILALLNEAKTNEPLLEQLTGLMFSYLKVSDNWYFDSLTMDEVRQNIVDGIDEALPSVEAYLATNTLLGDKGIVYAVVLDNEDCIISETIVIDVCFDYLLLNPYRYYYYGDDESDEPAEIVNFTVTVKNEYSNMNGNSSVVFPELTGENTVDLVAAMRNEIAKEKEEAKYAFPYSSYRYEDLREIEETPVEFPLRGTFEGNEINTTIKLIMITNDVYYKNYRMPIEQAAEVFGGSITWDEEAEMVTWAVDDGRMLVVTVAEEDDLSDVDRYYDYPVGTTFEDGNVQDGLTFVSIGRLEKFLNVDFGYDNDTGTVLLKAGDSRY